MKYSLTSLPLLSSAAPHLSSTLPVRTGSGNTRRKSFPGLESAGEIRAVQAHQRASGTISRWENRRALSLTAHVGKRNRGHAGLCAADLHARRTGLDIENVPREQEKMQRNNWPKLSHYLLFILLFLKKLKLAVTVVLTVQTPRQKCQMIFSQTNRYLDSHIQQHVIITASHF